MAASNPVDVLSDLPVDGEIAPESIALISGIIVCLLGASVWAGWILNIRLEGIRSVWPKMAPVTALAFVLAGVSLGCAVLAQPTQRPLLQQWFLRVSRASAICLTLIALLRLSDGLVGLHPISDLMGFREPVEQAYRILTRMAAPAAVGFVLLGGALYLAGRSRYIGSLQTLTLAGALPGWLGLCWYLYGGVPLSPYAHMSAHTVAGLLVLSTGLLCARPEAGLMALLRSDSAGGLLARQLLLPAMLLPFVFGWLGLKAQWAGWFGAEAGVSLFALSNGIMLAALVWITALVVHRSDERRRLMEEVLREHRDRLAAIIATEPECVKLVDSEGRLLEINPAGLAMLEVGSLEEARQRPFVHYLMPEYHAAFRKLHQKVIRGGVGILEFEIKGRRGECRWVETHAAPLRDARGNVVALLGVTRDIGGRKRAEAAQAQVRLFRDLLDRSNDLIYIADAQSGRLLDFNTTLPRRLGYTAEELRRMRVSDFSAAAGVGEDWPGRVARARELGWLMGERSYRCKNGSVLPVEVNLSYVEHEPRALLVAVIRDVTERRHQAARIASLTRTLKLQSAINSTVLRMTDRDQMLQEACRLGTQVGAYAQAIISVIEPGGRSARPAYKAGKEVIAKPPAVFPIGDGTEPDTSVTGRAIRTGEVVVADLRRSEPPVLARDLLLSAGFFWTIALPLTVDGERLGALTLSSTNPEPIPEEELLLLQDIAANLGFGLRSQCHADRVRFLAHYDPLTGLAKRALFCERLTALLEHSAATLENPIVAAVDVLDLSGVNDSFGRNVGDLLVQRVAERMRRVLEADEHIGYLGGGTFVLAVREAASVINSVAAAVDSAVFAQPFEIEGHSFRVSCHSGTARYPSDGKDAATLVQRAEAALRHAKERGEPSLQFTLQMHSEVAKRRQMENRLREAVDGWQFVLHYQPQVNLISGRIESVEALLRWREPNGSLTPAESFLSVLESSGLIVPVGAWALRQASQDCARWRSRGLGPLRVGVNVSSVQIRRRKFVEDVLQTVEGLTATADGFGLDLEITETVLLQDLDDARRKLHRLRAAGIRIAIDDFGTGYSSLGLLTTLPVDILKIDRVFIRGLPEDRASTALTSSIIQIASAFGLVTVAEGVERPAQLRMLRTFLCSQSQGYLHGKPMPREELEDLLAGERKC
jgi:diguanylate cyclase (GGDEF)-like protein/PAS domain S-box-containing protein